MGRNRKQRRQQHGSAWHWKQTDCWYYTLPGTKKRMPLFDENGQRIRGKENQEAAETALAKVKVADASESAGGPAARERWLVAKVCSEYLQYCERGVANGTISKGHRDNAVSLAQRSVRLLRRLAGRGTQEGARQDLAGKPRRLAVAGDAPQRHRHRAGRLQLCRGACTTSPTRSRASRSLRRSRGCTRSPRRTRKRSYGATEERFRDFLFAAIHTGLRPFCELARMTADDVEENGRGHDVAGLLLEDEEDPQDPGPAGGGRLTRRLMKTAPRGSGLPLFRNTKGKPWKRMTGVVRFLTLKKKLGWDKDPTKTKYSCYTCRHTFAHRMLSGYWNGGVGCSIETLAELIGDTPKVAFDHYGKEWGQHYQDPLWAAIGAGQQTATGRRAGQDATSPAEREVAERPACPSGSTKKARISDGQATGGTAER